MASSLTEENTATYVTVTVVKSTMNGKNQCQNNGNNHQLYLPYVFFPFLQELFYVPLASSESSASVTPIQAQKLSSMQQAFRMSTRETVKYATQHLKFNFCVFTYLNLYYRWP